MLRTNSKAARENVKNYILGYILDEEFGTLSSVYEAYLRENPYDRDYMVASHISDYDAFYYWATGLPCGGLFCYFYNREAKPDVMEILEETEEEAARFTEHDAENLLTLLIYREVLRAYEKLTK